ncbi:MFS transporter, partial [Lactobacillus sp. XV13L]|nr:MFS transporter [Lactobacillus sp. XV13L]
VKVSTSKHVNLKQGIHAMKNNWPWLLIVIGNFFFWVANTTRSQGLVYYFTYYFHNKGLVTAFNSVSILQIVGIVAIPFLNKIISKSNIWAVGSILAIIGQFFLMMSGRNIIGAAIGWIIGMIGSGLAVSMPFAMLGSAVDYGEWKNGINAAGILTTIGSAFCMSMGQGLAGYLNSTIMSSFGYVANHIQTAHALLGINISFNWVTIIMFLIAVIPALFYNKYEKMEEQIGTDLAAKRQ